MTQSIVSERTVASEVLCACEGLLFQESHAMAVSDLWVVWVGWGDERVAEKNSLD